MTDETANLTLHHLQAIRTDMTKLDDKVTIGFKEVNGKISLLADGLLSLRGDVGELRHDVENIDLNMKTLVLAVAGHGERLANVEDRLAPEQPDPARR